MSAIIGSTTSTLQTASFHLPNGTPSHWIHEPIVNDRADTSNPRLTDGNTSQDPNQRKRSSSLISLLTWNSFRRVFGPVKGNNKTGQKGKLICVHCRKIRSKVYTPFVKVKFQCIYPSDEDPCEFCTARNLKCIKVWGPKNRPPPMSTMPFGVSLINDSNLSDKDLTSIRYLFHWHNHTGGYWGTEWLTVALQHLWSVYGFTFSANKTLLYSLIAFSHYHMHRCKRDFDFFTLVSRFQRSLIVAIDKHDISDGHLFAIFFALETQGGDHYHRFAHQRGFIEVLKKLTQDEGDHDKSLLFHLYPFILSYVRRMDHYYNFDDRSHERLQLRYEMHTIAQNLPMPAIVLDTRTTVGLPLRFWRNKDLHPNWDALTFSLWDDMASLMVCFQQLFCIDASLQENGTRTHAATSIQSIIQNFESMLRWPHVVEVLNGVYSHPMIGS
jgi:hypothetical protein